MSAAAAKSTGKSRVAKPVSEAPSPAPPPAPERPAADRIHWAQGIDGAFLCWFACEVLYSFSPFVGLSVLGVGVLMVGAAFGRE